MHFLFPPLYLQLLFFEACRYWAPLAAICFHIFSSYTHQISRVPSLQINTFANISFERTASATCSCCQIVCFFFLIRWDGNPCHASQRLHASKPFLSHSNFVDFHLFLECNEIDLAASYVIVFGPRVCSYPHLSRCVTLSLARWLEYA